MIPARGARDINPTLGFFVMVRGSQKGHFMPGTCDMPLFQMNVGTALAAIGGLNGFRFPLKVVAVGAPNLDPRFCSHSELLTVQGCIRRTHFRSSKWSSCTRFVVIGDNNRAALQPHRKQLPKGNSLPCLSILCGNQRGYIQHQRFDGKDFAASGWLNQAIQICSSPALVSSGN